MGILSYMATGAAEGAGKAVAGYGVDLMRRADAQDQETLRQRDRLELARERAALSASGQGQRKPTPAEELSQLADLMLSPKGSALLRMGGMAPGEADDGAGLIAGRQPSRDIALDPSRFTNPDRQDEAAAGQKSVAVPKYNDGEAKALSERSFMALRRAVGLTEPNSADNIAKAELTNQETGLIRRASEGDNSAASALLNAKGHGQFGESGNVLTGGVAKGSVAEAKRNEANAKAGEASAHAGKYKAEADKLVSEANGAIASGANRERLNNLLNSLNNTAKDMDVQSDPAMKKSIMDARSKIINAINGVVDDKAEASGGRAGPGRQEAPRDPAKRRVGQVYDTPKGPLTWTGKGWTR